MPLRKFVIKKISIYLEDMKNVCIFASRNVRPEVAKAII